MNSRFVVEAVKTGRLQSVCSRNCTAALLGARWILLCRIGAKGNVQQTGRCCKRRLSC